MKNKQIILKLTLEKHTNFKAKCVTNNESMTSILESMISHYIENDSIGLVADRVIIDKLVYTNIGDSDAPCEVINLNGDIESLVITKSKSRKGVETFKSKDRYFAYYAERIREITTHDIKSILTHGNIFIKQLEKRLKEKLTKDNHVDNLTQH